jgi:integrase
LALRWPDVNLETGILAVRATLDPLSGELGEPKTDRSRRTLELPLPVVAVLRRHRAAQAEAGADLFEVSRALGHASITTTANVYGHFTIAMAERAADRMTAILESHPDRLGGTAGGTT